MKVRCESLVCAEGGHGIFRKGREDERATLDVSAAVPRTELAREDG